MRAVKSFIGIFIVAVSLILLFFPAGGHAETLIVLKDGRRIKVENFWRENEMVKYQSYGGIVGIPGEDVERIITPDMVAFDEAQGVHTIDAYEQFLRKYPQSSLVADARDRISALTFEKVKQIHSAQAYLDYIRRNPQSAFLQEAKERAEDLVFQEAVVINQLDQFQEYLEIYPEGKFSRAARKAVEIIKYDAVKQSVNIPDIETYLHDYPQSAYRRGLENRLAQLVSESEAKAKAKQEQELKKKKLQELEAKKRHRFWMVLLSVAGLLSVSVPAALFFVKKRKAGMTASGKGVTESKKGLPQEEYGQKSPFKKEPVRYEDLISTPRNRDPQSASGSETTLALDHKTQFSLPEPEKKGGSSSEEETDPLKDQFENASFAKEETAIPMGYKEDKGPDEKPSSYERTIDLSDHETDFNLELEDVPEETEGKETKWPYS